jgi:hypothetical protein
MVFPFADDYSLSDVGFQACILESALFNLAGECLTKMIINAQKMVCWLV